MHSFIPFFCVATSQPLSVRIVSDFLSNVVDRVFLEGEFYGAGVCTPGYLVHR